MDKMNGEDVLDIPVKTYTVTEAANKLKIEAHVLRYWEEELHLHIPRNELGRRYYREMDLGLFLKIRQDKQKGMKLKEIKEYIEKNGIMSYLKRKNPEEARAFTVVQDSEKKQNRFINGKPRMNLINMTENNITSISPNMNVTRGEITVENAVEDRVEKNPDIVQNNAMKMQKLQELLTNAISHVVEENTKTMYKTVSEDVKQVVLKELDYQFRQNEERFQNWENSRLEREKQRMEREEEHYKKLDDLLRSYGKNKGSRKEKKPQE